MARTGGLVTAFSLPLPDIDDVFSPSAGLKRNSPDGKLGTGLPICHEEEPEQEASHGSPTISRKLTPQCNLTVEVKSVSTPQWEAGAAWVQGFRPSMEDAHVVELTLDRETGLLGVFDGHGGLHCAKFCADHVASTLCQTPGWAAGDVSAALSETFLALDQAINQSCPASSGTTSTVAVLKGGRLWVAGVGDSKCVLVRNGRALPMTVDHRPDAPEEEARIRCAGGFVLGGRVNACLNVSRALGDAQFKQDKFRPPAEQQVSPLPDVKEATVRSPADFLLICSDGVWNSMREPAVLRFVRDKLLAGMAPADVCHDLCKACLEPCRTAYDNITAVLCKFKAIVVPTPAGVADGEATRNSKRRSLDSRTGQGSTPPVAIPVAAAPAGPTILDDEESMGRGAAPDDSGRSSPITPGTPVNETPSPPMCVTPPSEASSGSRGGQGGLSRNSSAGHPASSAPWAASARPAAPPAAAAQQHTVKNGGPGPSPLSAAGRAAAAGAMHTASAPAPGGGVVATAVTLTPVPLHGAGREEGDAKSPLPKRRSLH